MNQFRDSESGWDCVACVTNNTQHKRDDSGLFDQCVRWWERGRGRDRAELWFIFHSNIDILIEVLIF